MTERFSGRITLDEGDEVEVDLELSDDEVRLATESAEIGVWPRPDCEIRDSGEGVYLLIVDDDVVTFVPTESETFGKALSNGASPIEGDLASDGDEVVGEGDEAQATTPTSGDGGGSYFISVEPSDQPTESEAVEFDEAGTESPSNEEPVTPLFGLPPLAEAPSDGYAVEGESLSTYSDLQDVEQADVAEDRQELLDSKSFFAPDVGDDRADGFAAVPPAPSEESPPADDSIVTIPEDDTASSPGSTWLLPPEGDQSAPTSQLDPHQVEFDVEEEAGAQQWVEVVEVEDEAAPRGSALTIEDGDSPHDPGPQVEAATVGDDVDYEELAAALEELAEEQAAETEDSAVAEEPAEEVEGSAVTEEPAVEVEGDAESEEHAVDAPVSEPSGRGWFRRRSTAPEEEAEPTEVEESTDAGEEEAESTEVEESTDAGEEEADPRTQGWFQDPSREPKAPEPVDEPVEMEDAPKVRSSTERLAAAVGALKHQRSLTPAEQAIAEAEGESTSVISTDEVMESQRNLRKSNVVRRLTWDLVRKVGAGVLLGLGIAVLVFLFPSAWEVLTRDSEPTVIVEDPPNTTTVDSAVTTATTAPEDTVSTGPETTAPTTTTTQVSSVSIFDLTGDEFFARWNQRAIPIDQVLAFAVYPPPGAFENEFFPYLSMTGTIGERGTIDEFGIVVDPTGPTDSDWLAIQALGVAIAVVEPDLTGLERADILGTLGLDVRQPLLAGIDASIQRGPHQYRLVFDEETILLTLTISPAGVVLP